MVKVIAALALALVWAPQEPPGQDKPGQDKPGTDRGQTQDLDAALLKAGQMGNYTANISMRKDGGTEPGKDSGLQPIEYRLMPGAAAHVKCGDIEGYRQGEVFVIKEGETWKKFEEGAVTDKDKGGVPIDKLAKLRAPHEFLKDFKSTSFKQVRREDTEGGRLYSGELTDDALRKLLAGKKGDAGMQAGTGRAKIWVNGEGAVSRYELLIEHKSQTGEAARLTKTIEFREIGSTKYDVPPEALKALGSTPTEKKPMGEK